MSSRWPCCSSIWCSRRSTKAGLTPAAVILVVPLALLGHGRGAVASAGLDNNIYTQIGIVLIIALASKNAILIVEFARDLHAQGHGIAEAAAEAAREALPADPR